MKISVQEVSRLLAYSSVGRGEVRSTSGSTASSGASSNTLSAASVDLSGSALEVQRVKRWVNSLPDVRQDRVNALKAQIDNGTYHVSGEDIADLIIRRALADNTAA